MKIKMQIVTVLVSAIFIGGCTTTPPTPTPQEVVQPVEVHSAEVKVSPPPKKKLKKKKNPIPSSPCPTQEALVKAAREAGRKEGLKEAEERWKASL